jgi:hypothetical protein
MNTDRTNPNLVTAMFADHAAATAAIAELRENGVNNEALSVIGRGHEGEGLATGEIGDSDVADNQHVARGAIGGGALGGGLAMAALLIPGVGPLVAGGILATALTTGVAVGAGIGGLAEALRDQGVNEADAAYYEANMGDTSTMVAVDAENTSISADRIDDILMRNGGQRSAAPATGTMADTLA